MMMNAMDTNITIDVAAVVIAIGTAGGALIGAWAAKRKVNADASKVEAEAKKLDSDVDKATLTSATSMIKRLEAEVRKMAFRIDSLEEELGVERARSEDTRRKYLAALDRIVELEREVISLRKQVGGTVNGTVTQ